MKIKNIIRFLDCYPITTSLFFAVGFNFLLFGGAFAMLASVLFLQGILSYLFFTMGFISSIASFYLLNAINKIGGSL